MSIRKGLMKNFGAGLWSKASTIFFRLIQVPLIVSALGVEDYGRWLVLYSLPSWLMLANLGFGSVAANEMSMSVAKEDLVKARQIFSTTLALVLLIDIIGIAIVIPFAYLVHWESFLKAGPDRHHEIAMAIIYLALSVFISFFFEIFGGRLRGARKSHLFVLLSSFYPWTSLLGLVIILPFSHRFDHLALSQLGASILFFIIYQWTSWRVMPALSFSFKCIKFNRSGYLFRKGLAFQAFPLGNALIFQGNIIIVQAILGPAAVALFGTTRTLVRTVNQAMEMVNQAIWPEMSHLFGANELAKAAKLHRVGVGVSVALSCTGVLLLALLGKPIYTIWVGEEIHLSQHLLFIFLLSIPFNAMWLTSSVVHMASNEHEGLAIRYLLATIVSAACCLCFSYFLGIEGAALSTVIADIILIPYVFKKSLSLTGDKWSNFSLSLFNDIKELPALIKRT